MQIFAAIKRADAAGVQECLDSGVDVDCPDEWTREKPVAERWDCGGWSPLGKALYLEPSAGKTAILELLLASGASLDLVTSAMPDDPPLCLLAEHGDADSMRLLLKAGADPKLTGRSFSPLGAAVKAESLEAVRVLLEAGVAFPASGPRARAFLHLAASSREMLDLLRENGLVPANCPLESDEEPGVLDGTIRRGDREHLAWLIAQGVDPADTSWDGTCQRLYCGTDEEFARHLTSLPLPLDPELCEFAVERDLVGKLKRLFAADPALMNPHPPVGESSLLHRAARYSASQCLAYLLSLGYAVNHAGGLLKTPLMEACDYGRPDCARLLLEAGAEVNSRNEFGETAAIMAAEWNSAASGSLAFLQLLQQYGADLDCQTDLRLCVLTHVAERGDAEVLRWVVAQGVQLNPDSFEGTPLRRAVLNDDLVCMEILLAAGANPNFRLEDDETVLFDVRSRESVRLLLRYGANPALKDNLFERTAEESIRDPMIRAAFHAGA